jgi:DNA-binding response OmpR family regulator
MKGNSILIIEDEKRLAEILKNQLEESGFTVTLADNGVTGKELAAKEIFNLILLDINIPLINGYELCREIRSTNKDIPIIMLTALGTADNKITGFDAGADDYIVKPFDYRELLARVNVFLRRTETRQEEHILKVADLEMNLATKSVTRAGTKIELTAREYNLLKTFMENSGRLLSREFIIETVWGIDFDPSTNIIDVYINYLRKKVDRDFDRRLLHTKFGFGFYLSEKEI